MYYVCIENNVIASILNYEPAAPESMTVVTISDAEEKSIRDQTHTFDIATKSVVPVANAEFVTVIAGLLLVLIKLAQ